MVESLLLALVETQPLWLWTRVHNGHVKNDCPYRVVFAIDTSVVSR